MEIERIHYQYYDNRGMFFSRDFSGKEQKKKTPIRKKPIDAVTFDVLELDNKNKEIDNEVSQLTLLVKSLPDSFVNERMTELKNTYPIIDDFLIEKLLMEVL